MDLSVAGKVFTSVLIAFIVFGITSVIIGPERKSLWFRKRKKYTLFTRRGPLGEILHFGHPVTMEGYIVTFLMCLVIGIGSYIICVM